MFIVVHRSRENISDTDIVEEPYVWNDSREEREHRKVVVQNHLND